MLETVTKGFRNARLKLQGKTTLSEDNIKTALRDVRVSLLEADVELGVVKSFLARVQERTGGEVVQLKVKDPIPNLPPGVKVTPADHFIKICHDELVELMGPVDAELTTEADPAIAIAREGTINGEADDASEEEDEGIEHALDQGERHHVAVGDVGHFVGQHGSDFLVRHRFQQAGRHRHQRCVLGRAGGEGVRLTGVDGHFRHLDTGFLRLGGDGVHQPQLGRVGRLLDHACTGRPFGDRFRQPQGDEGAAEAHQGGETEQHAEVEAIGGQVSVHAKQAGRDAQHKHDGKVGSDKENDPFHVPSLVKSIKKMVV